REEEPQIIVPMVDILISQPGSSPEEVERQSVIELESLLRGLPGVEHVYSSSMRDGALVSVRFEVGHDREKALVDTVTRMQAFADRISPDIAGHVVRPVDIDDVPALTLALHADDSGDAAGLDLVALGRVAEELATEIGTVDDVALVDVIGSQPSAFEVVPDLARLEAHGLTLLGLMEKLRAADSGATLGESYQGGERVRVAAGPFLRRLSDLSTIVVSSDETGRPVLLEEVAELRMGPLEPERYTRIAFGPSGVKRGNLVDGEDHGERLAVAISVAKRQGSNAVEVTRDVLDLIDDSALLEGGLTYTVTRDDGQTADRKVNELVEHITVAVITVILVLMLGLGVREALIVAITVPVTFSIALAFNLAFGFTINRVTLFALVLSLGLLVDDPIVDVENIHRHYALRLRSAKEAVIYAVNEVRPPLILATMTVIVSFLPMYFITGMMGPYMAPMPFNITVVMLSSLVVALTITPWASYRILKQPAEGEHRDEGGAGGFAGRIYRVTMRPLMRHRPLAFLALGGLFVAWVGSIALAIFGVPLKMLPFSNKDRLEVRVEMPESASLEDTDALVRDLADLLVEEPDVAFVESFAGTSSPHDFQGLVRHDFLREGDHVGDLRIGLLPDSLREMQSHQIALRLRADVERIAAEHGGRAAIVEVPPGPPVLQTVVAEVTGPVDAGWDELLAVGSDVFDRFEDYPGVVDVDWQVNEPQARWTYQVDRQLAGRAGISTAEVVGSLDAALGTRPFGTVHVPGERHPMPLYLRLSEAERSDPAALANLPLRFGAEGQTLPLGAVARLSPEVVEPAITRKDGRRVVFVTADAVGISPADAVLGIGAGLGDAPLPPGYEASFSGEGEWKITLDVFRDLGLAFGAALLGIYLLLVAQTGSLFLPLVMMVSIPVTAIGIFPGFWLINQLTAGEVAGLANPTWFTATAMIGMIALAGIVVRNSVILVDFIEVQLDEGNSLAKAVVEAGAVRLRPIMLTAGTALLGVWVMTLDPVFSGLAWSFIFGIVASTLFTLVVVPLIYYLLNQGKPEYRAPAPKAA
ncbi:MAG: efflux RND transporter permease subunit, partial [Planctomycetota bacterium]|nr:efflux RND transporter permease subunit [Planctomycetota bacterium]